jgi:putative endonuclease
MVRRLASMPTIGVQPVGASPSGKAPDFDSGIRRFDPFRPSQPTLLRSFGWLTPLKISDAARQRRLSAEAPKERRRTDQQRVPMHYVYLMQSKCNSSQRYVGYTSDLKRRLRSHNAGASIHTRKYAPWQIVAYFAFSAERRAREFEFYLKSGSGRAFANKRFW